MTVTINPSDIEILKGIVPLLFFYVGGYLMGRREGKREAQKPK